MAADGPKLGDEWVSAALAAQKGAPALPKRFFASAQAERRGTGFTLLLDGRAAKTPARRDLALPSEAAALAVADEWNRLGAVIDPAIMPLTRIVNAAIDGVTLQFEAVFEEVCAYLGSDLLFYRAAGPDPLVRAQAEAWDPVLDLYRAGGGARFVLAQSIMPVTQPPATLSMIRQELAEAIGDGAAAPFRLAALNVMTTLTGSALLGLTVLSARLSPEAAWAAAHVDETFQESRWGQDLEALERRAGRWREMQAAALLGASVTPAVDG